MLADDRRHFERTVNETFKGRSLQVGGKRYDFPKFR